MRYWTCATIFMFLLIVPIGLPVVHALPWCGCGYCYMQATGQCTCGYPYHWCLEDLQALQLQAHVNTMSTEIKPNHTVASASADPAYMIRGGQCLYNRVAVHLLWNARENVNFVTVKFD